MIDTVFWCTGFAVWVLILLGAVSMLIVQARDWSVLRRGEHFNRRQGWSPLPVTVHALAAIEAPWRAPVVI
jgi:hypothetical protein